ncbi:MAG: hypothetical protein Q9173_001947, partial [Seirophora scorigena]
MVGQDQHNELQGFQRCDRSEKAQVLREAELDRAGTKHKSRSGKRHRRPPQMKAQVIGIPSDLDLLVRVEVRPDERFIPFAIPSSSFIQQAMQETCWIEFEEEAIHKMVGASFYKKANHPSGGLAAPTITQGIYLDAIEGSDKHE